jgi:hypothetical protein
MATIKSLPTVLRLTLAGVVALVVLPLGFVSCSAIWRIVGWRTVATERKSYPRFPATFGYTLQRPLGRSDFLLTFSGYRFSIQLESPGTSLNSVLDKRWMCNDRVLYLSLDTRNDYGSYWLDETVKVIFDFERTALYTFNSPWRVGSPDDGKIRAVTEAQFAEMLQTFANECQPANSQK